MDTKKINPQVIEQFRGGGEIPGMHRERLVLLTTTGAKTKAERTTPLMFHRDGDRIYVIASNSGATKAPDWYHNLLANPRVKVELADETFEAQAEPLEGSERERVWTEIKRLFPFFGHHEKQANRTIPVVELARTEPNRRD
ncbi:MAG TPA: nitroreductase/quinone reductase family protein [Candidatus Limnocylindrales bacterium]|nr:nitroreductase/quinone reductase family protein [Candidatus Limnocylindrales bacterium]